MRLFIAEKTSAAKAIAAELGMTGNGDGLIECDAGKVTRCFGRMREQAEPDVEAANARVQFKTWDTARITAHHDIIPAMHHGGTTALGPKAKIICAVIVRAYMARFYPLHECVSTNIAVTAAGETFRASGTTVIRNGWRGHRHTRDSCHHHFKTETSGAS